MAPFDGVSSAITANVILCFRCCLRGSYRLFWHQFLFYFRLNHVYDGYSNHHHNKSIRKWLWGFQPVQQGKNCKANVRRARLSSISTSLWNLHAWALGAASLQLGYHLCAHNIHFPNHLLCRLITLFSLNVFCFHVNSFYYFWILNVFCEFTFHSSICWRWI